MRDAPLHLVRLDVDLPGLARVAQDRGWTRGRRIAFDEGAALHHVLGETFGPRALQPFRLIVSPRQRGAKLYAYANAPAEDLMRAAQEFGTPETLAALGNGLVQDKPMPPPFEAGRRLGFDLRLRPVVRLAKDVSIPDDRQRGRRHGFKKGAEVDAFLAEALRDPNRDAMHEAGRAREDVYRDWLAARLSPGANLEEVRLTTLRRSLAARGAQGVEGPDAVMQGTLQVRDTACFEALLRTGVGRHKAYGYGMLLLRPAGAAVPEA